MALALIKTEHLEAIGDALRAKTGDEGYYYPQDMALAIEELDTGVRGLLEDTLTDLVSDAITVRAYACYNNATLENVELTQAYYIGERAFGGCRSLREVTLHDCQTIAYNAFNYATSLQTLYIKGSTAPILQNTGAFSMTPIESGTGQIIIEDENVYNELLGATNWSTFANVMIWEGDL